MNDLYSEDRIRSAVGTGRFGTPLHFFEVVESTQRVALGLAEKGAPEGSLVVSDGQTAGMGRRGRTWHSVSGAGIWLSLVLRPPIQPSDGGLLSAWVGLSVLAALEACGLNRVKAGLKWPNDLIADGRKLGGILIDAKTVGEKIAYAVVGLGLNVNHDLGDFPSDIASTATSLRIVRGEICDRAAILGEILRELDRTYGRIHDEDGRRVIASDAQRVSVLIGKHVTVKSHLGSLSGTAVRIDSDGALVMHPGTGKEERVLTGDVEMVRVREEKQ
jgi:BirA family biotin operon repressor/biotin-[acetyl-CoA-carboxylase] ligase